MTLTTKTAAGLVPAAGKQKPRQSTKVFQRTHGGELVCIEIFHGTVLEAKRGFGARGRSVAIGETVTVGEEGIDLATAFMLIDTGKAKVASIKERKSKSDPPAR